ncbi:MAG: hypothetical protein R6X02_04030 [Enhygromyxa sp.]
MHTLTSGMARTAPHVAFVLALAGCRGPVGASATAEPRVWNHEYVVDERAGRFALLSPKTPLHAGPDDPIAVWTTDHEHIVARVLGQVGDRIEIELDWLDDDAYRCSPSLGTLGLKVYTDLARLADVVTQPSRVDFADHSALIIAPGVRVFVKDGRQTLESRPWFGWGNGDISVVTDARLPIGKFFTPVRADSLPTAIGTTSGASVRFGDDGSVHAIMAGVFARSPTNWSAAALGNACLIVIGEQVGERIYIHGDRYFQVLPMRHWVVKAGSLLRWPDGSPAGVAYHENVVLDEPRTVGELRCVTPTQVRGWPLDGLEVCVDGEALREIDNLPDQWSEEPGSG